MTFDAVVNGRSRVVTIDAARGGGDARGRVHVVVDGVREEVDVQETDVGWILKFATGRVADAAVTAHAAGWLVQFPHVTVTVTAPARDRQESARVDEASAGPRRVVSPMPGRVVRVLVKRGDTVAAREGLVVLEAMKMENEVPAPKAGRILEVAVEEGQSIEAGRLLVIVE